MILPSLSVRDSGHYTFTGLRKSNGLLALCITPHFEESSDLMTRNRPSVWLFTRDEVAALIGCLSAVHDSMKPH